MIKREKKILKNGLTHIHYHVPFLKTVTMSIYVKAGGIDETSPELFGISHFLEHMLFNGSHKYPSREGTDVAIVGMGYYQNAWTWFAQTNYYLNGSVESLPEAFDILLNRVFDPILRTKDIEKEKGIIQEERVMGENSPERELYYKINNDLYKNNPAGHEIIGTKASIAGFSKKLLTDFHDTYYSPRNIVLITYGGITYEEISDEVTEKIEAIENKPEVEFAEDLSLTIKGRSDPLELILEKDTTASFIQDFAIFEKPSTLEEYVNWVYIRAILEEGKSAVLEKKLVLDNSYVSSYDLDVFINGLYLNFLFGATTDKQKLDTVRDVYSEVFTNIADYLTEDSLKRAKGFLRGKLLVSIEDPFIIADSDFLNVEYLNQILDVEVDFEQLSEALLEKDIRSLKKFAGSVRPVSRGIGEIR